MENRKPMSFAFIVIAVILGWTLFKQFDFENLQFEHTGLAVVYLVTFLFSIYFLIKNAKKHSEK